MGIKIKREDSICQRCLEDAVATWEDDGWEGPEFLARRLREGFCIFNVQENGNLHVSLGDASRDVPAQCKYGAEQAVSHVTDEERAEAKIEDIHDGIQRAVQAAWKYGWTVKEEPCGAGKKFTFTPKGRGEPREVVLSGAAELHAGEHCALSTMVRIMEGTWPRGTLS